MRYFYLDFVFFKVNKGKKSGFLVACDLGV